MMLPLWAFWLFTIVGTVGSLASIIGLAFSMYIYNKEKIIESDVINMKYDEELWHRERMEGKRA